MSVGRPLPVAVLFDYNGTLADDEQVVCAAYQDLHLHYFAAQLGVDEYFARLVGRSDEEILQETLANLQPVRAVSMAILREDLRDRYRRATRSVELIPRTARLVVARLAAIGVRLGVVTGAQREQVIPVLSAAGLLPLFEVVVTVEDVDEGKPSPAGYQRAREALHLLADELVWAVEDSVVGLRAARAAGMATVAVLGSHPRDQLECEADYLIERLDFSLLALPPFSESAPAVQSLD